MISGLFSIRSGCWCCMWIDELGWLNSLCMIFTGYHISYEFHHCIMFSPFLFLYHRVVVVSRNATLLQLMVERLGYLDKVVMVTYKTLQLDSGISIAGLSASPALEGADYFRSIGTIAFDYGVVSTCLLRFCFPSVGLKVKLQRLDLVNLTL